MRKGTKQTGQFQIQEGMIFTMPSINQFHINGDKIQANTHPWLIVNKFEDYVEIVMCKTLSSNKEEKHRGFQLNHDNTTDITHPCPPMDRPQDRTSGVSLNTALLLPIKELFSNPIQILNNNTSSCNFTTHGLKSLCLQQPNLKNLQKELLEYQQKHPETRQDPFQCEEQIGHLYDLQDGLPVPKDFTKESYQKQFGWKHIKPANTYAVYPFEDQMHDYEKADPELLRIAREKKKSYNNNNNKSSVHKQQKPVNKTIHLQVNNETLSDEDLERALAEKAEQRHRQHSEKSQPQKTKLSRQENKIKGKTIGNIEKPYDPNDGLTGPN